MIVLKSAREIALMRRAGHILAGVVERLRGFVRPGMSTLEIDEDVEAYIHREGAAPAFKGYRGFPATACISINEEVVHGIPSARRKIREGDIVGLDPAGSVDYHEADYPERTCLVVGAEGPGLSRLVRQRCDLTVRIPMQGALASVNAAVAAAIVMAEAGRHLQ